MLERFAQFVEKWWRTNYSDSNKTHAFLSSTLVKRYLNRYIFFKCRRSIAYCYNTSPFYHDLLKSANIKPADIKSPGDMRKIPLTDSCDLVHPERFFSVPISRFIRVHSTAGSTGIPKRIFFTPKDIEQQITRNATGFRLFYGMNENDRVRIMYEIGYGMNDWGIRYCMENAVQRLGALAVTTGGVLSAEDEFQMLSNYKVTNIFGTPSRLLSLTCQLEKNHDLKSLHIRNILLGAEPLPSLTRTRLKNIWGANIFQGYGLTELGGSIAGECCEKDGMHVTESDVFVEVIDPKTSEILEDEAIGELVFTTLDREGMPLVRYRTHDLGMILHDDCPCGLPFRRIQVKGRNDKIFTIGSGDKLSPATLDNIILNLPNVMDYQLILDRECEKDSLTILVETTSQDTSIQQEIIDTLMSIPEIHHGVNCSRTIEYPRVQLLKPHTLVSDAVKARRIVDKRHLYE